jgi:hypothetical protein
MSNYSSSSIESCYFGVIFLIIMGGGCMSMTVNSNLR